MLRMHKKLCIGFSITFVIVAGIFAYITAKKQPNDPSLKDTGSQTLTFEKIYKKTLGIITDKNIPGGPDCFRSQDLPPSEVVLYSDTTRGISFEIPFNPKWSVEECHLPPFEQIENAIVFGPFDVYGYRVYRLETIPRLSIEKTMETMKQDNQQGIKKGQQEELTFEKHELHGISMLEFFPSAPGKCPGSTLIVFGEKSNFRLSSPCVFPQGGIENEPIIKSIRLLPS